MMLAFLAPVVVVAATLIVVLIVDILLDQQAAYEDIDPFTGEPAYYPDTLEKIGQLRFFKEIENV